MVFIKQNLMGYLSQIRLIRETECIITQRHVEINDKNKKKSTVKRCEKKLKRYFSEYKYRSIHITFLGQSDYSYRKSLKIFTEHCCSHCASRVTHVS